MCRMFHLSIMFAALFAAPSSGQQSPEPSFPVSGEPFSESGRDTLSAAGGVDSTAPTYSQDSRAIDPRALVQRNAAFRGTQRQYRLTAVRWFGYSNMRPDASPNPFYSTYSPIWAGNGWAPYRWVGVGPLW
jgi:hypothetical protein